MSGWYRSLYWRIAIGFVLSLAAILVVQAMLFVWVVSQSGPDFPGQPPERFARTVAREVTDTLERDAHADVRHFINTQFPRNAHPFIILMGEGRVINHAGAFAGPLLTSARIKLETLRRGADAENGESPPPAQGDQSDQARIRAVTAPIVAKSGRIGVVAVWPRTPFGFLLRQFAPALTLVATAALLLGATLAAFLIFGPARRRLRAVEDAARRLGAGDLTARAPVRGGDEVAAVATAFNAMANDLAARAEALLASNRARRQLLADVSHELTTPMTAMRGYLETLTMPEFELDEATRARYLQIMSDETARLERIIGDLLELARLEGGGGSLVVDDVPVGQLFDRVLARHERASQDAGVRIATHIEPGAETLTGDQDRLEQALQNLAANALRYAPRGSTIELGARATEGAVELTVSDAGSGIASEHLPHIFDRFYKAEVSRTVYGSDASTNGSGLGLSIVKAIVERHGGTVSVASRPGRTVFTLRLSTRQLPAPVSA